MLLRVTANKYGEVFERRKRRWMRRGRALEKSQTFNESPRSRIVIEFNYLKITALFLLIFVHSDLIIAFPEVIYPVQWFLLSAFFFMSGFLAYDSFHRRGDSIRLFF
jgi:hypothetical protein